MNTLVEKLINLGFSHYVRDEGKETENHVLNHNKIDLQINIFDHFLKGKVYGVKSYRLNIETHTNKPDKLCESIERLIEDPFQFRVDSLKGLLDCIEKLNKTVHPILVEEYGFYRLPFLWEEVSCGGSNEKFKPFLEYSHKKLRSDRLYNLKFYYDYLNTTLMWLDDDILDPTFDMRKAIESNLSKYEAYLGIIKTPVKVPMEKIIEMVRQNRGKKISVDIFDFVELENYEELLKEINNMGLEIV